MSSVVARLVLLSLLAALAVLPAAAAGAQDLPPDPVALDDGWSFVLDRADRGLAEGRPAAAGGGWEPVSVPHVFDAEPREELFGGTVGWYRTEFEGPRAGAGLAWDLRFEQVRRTARVWLNGQELGSHRDPYVPFELPAAGLRPGERNVLVVRVDHRKGAEPREGWWNWGGISRPVTLVPRGAVVLEHPGLLPRRRCAEGRCRWSVRADGWVVNRSAAVQRPVVDVALRAPDGTVSRATERPRALQPGERVRVRFDVPVAGRAQLWSPDAPALYDATVQTRLGAAVAQVDERRIGLRHVDVQDGMLRLNGRVLDLRGASIQEDVKGRGAALTDTEIDQTVAELQAVGANVTRAHYLLNERLLERFDEAGIMVFSQAPVYHRDDLLVTPEGRARELASLRGTVLAARGHPSVITHSVANELSPFPDDEPATARWLRSAARLTRDLDPTLPVSLDLLSYPRIERQAAYDDFDLLGINSYYGWYEGKRDRSTADLDDLVPYLRSMHEKYPDHALVMTEFGAEATFDGPADVKETYAFQTEYVRANLDVVDDLPFLSGAIYWTMREFAVKPDWDGGANRDVERDGMHRKALLTYDGTRKPAWEVARADFESTPVFRPDTARAARMAQLSGAGGLGGTLLAGGVVALVLAFLALDAWCVLGIWRASRRRPGDERLQAQVVTLRRAA
jgi:beta-glucuronidase